MSGFLWFRFEFSFALFLQAAVFHLSSPWCRGLLTRLPRAADHLLSRWSPPVAWSKNPGHTRSWPAYLPRKLASAASSFHWIGGKCSLRESKESKDAEGRCAQPLSSSGMWQQAAMAIQVMATPPCCPASFAWQVADVDVPRNAAQAVLHPSIHPSIHPHMHLAVHNMPVSMYVCICVCIWDECSSDSAFKTSVRRCVTHSRKDIPTIKSTATHIWCCLNRTPQSLNQKLYGLLLVTYLRSQRAVLA